MLQLDRLYLWLMGLAPLALMLAMLLIPRWRRKGLRTRGEIVFTGLLAAGVCGFAAWNILRKDAGGSHVYIQKPALLLLYVPLLGALLLLQHYTLSGISRGRMWTAYLLRSAIIGLILLAVAGLQMVISRDALTVLFALDVSKSVPEPERKRALEFVKKAASTRKANDEAGLMVFGGKASEEIQPTNTFVAPEAGKIKSVVAPDATNIALALRRAGASIDEGAQRRVLLFTDGRQTTGDALDELKHAVAMGIDVWIMPLRRGDNAEMLVEKIVLTSEQLLWEQPYDANVFVISNVTARAKVSLYPGDPAGQAVYEQLVDLKPGKNRIPFSGLKMHSGGAKEIKAVIEPLNKADDTLSENNEAYAFVDVQTDSRVLIMTSDRAEVKYLVSALEGEKLTLDVRSGATLPDNPEDFRAYDCIVLANLARSMLTEKQMAVIQSCVRDQGAGLIMIGGDQSFGAGGYLNTPVEETLPVHMDLQNQKVMPSGALVIVLHTCEFADGNGWGKKISKAAIDVLSPQDYAGLIYYGNFGGETWCFKPALVRKERMFSLIDGCEPGDMPSLDTIVSMAVSSLANLNNVSLKHSIIITDGDPSPPTASTIAAAKNAKISITTISISPHGGADIAMLKDVATQTGGRYYPAADPKKLPQIFVKEAAVVRKSLIKTDDRGIPISFGTAGPVLKEFGRTFPTVKALVMTQPKDRAEMHLFTVAEGEKIPILMSWQYGLGKAVAFTSDSTNRWAPEWVSWSEYKKFWANLFTYVSRQRMPPNYNVTTRLEGDTGRVIVEGIDAKGDYINFAKLIGNVVDPDVARDSTNAEKFVLNFTMTNAGRYEATFPIKKAGAYAVTVTDMSNAKKPQSIVTGLANSYSAEFLHLDPDEALLKKMGDVAKAKFTVERYKEDWETMDPLTANVFAHDLPPAQRPTDLFWTLILIALCIFPLDVAVRRLALDPEVAFVAVRNALEPALVALKVKKRKLQEAAVDAIAGAAAQKPSEIVPSGDQSRAAQSRYESAGGSDAAKDLNLNPSAELDAKKPVVGGTKLTTADTAASDYTRSLLKAKKRATKN